MKYQIIRMNAGRQQHFDHSAGKFKTSADRWDGEFEAATPSDARAIYERAKSKCRKTTSCSLPTLHEII